MYRQKNTDFANCYRPQKAYSLLVEVHYLVVVFSDNNTQLVNYINYEKLSYGLTMFSECFIQVNVAIIIIM